MEHKGQQLETRAIHAGAPKPRYEGAVVTPIFQSTVYETPEVIERYDDIVYPRLNNLPNHVGLAQKLASLENAEAGVVFATGMAAIATALLSVAGRDGHILVQDHLYGGTRTLVQQYFRDWEVHYDFIDSERPETWAAKLRPNTRAIYVEAIANPLLQIADHRAVVAFAREKGLLAMIDSTFASPVNFQPRDLGYDLVIHSCTKYLNGHSDVIAGAVVGASETIETLKSLANHLGASLDAHACFLLDRGLKTLALRVRQQNDNALQLSEWLSNHSDVSKIFYPGLPSHPQHERAKELFAGYGGMLAFELSGGESAARRFTDRLRLVTYGPSLGGVESLITRPSVTSHAGLSEDERQTLGITPGVFRLSVGIEAVEDIIGDLNAALTE